MSITPSDWTLPLSAVSQSMVFEPVMTTFNPHVVPLQTNPPTQSLSELHDVLHAEPEHFREPGHVVAAGVWHLPAPLQVLWPVDMLPEHEGPGLQVAVE